MNKKDLTKKDINVNTKHQYEAKIIKQAISQIDCQPQNQPSLDDFRNLVRTEVAKKEKRQQKALYAFSVLAILILSVLLTACTKNPTIIIKLQLASLAAIPFAIIKYGKKVGSQ